jgi:hypothetical protein
MIEKQKALVFDIEVSPSSGYFWSNPWQTSIIKVIEEVKIPEEPTNNFNSEGKDTKKNEKYVRSS